MRKYGNDTIEKSLKIDCLRLSSAGHQTSITECLILQISGNEKCASATILNFQLKIILFVELLERR